MRTPEYRQIGFKRLTEVNLEALVDMMNDPDVRRHMPLARDGFTVDDAKRFVAIKEQIWENTGYGPWAFMLNGELVGWGGLQPEGADVDVGLVLRPAYWGAGKVLYKQILAYAFGTLGLDSVIALLPPSRTRVAGLRRLGFVEDGEVVLGAERFNRYRLYSQL